MARESRDDGRRRPRDMWVFAYGSLMWDPGFSYRMVRPALLKGYHRALCIYSRWHRGTPDRPGLVLGLDRGGSCRGLAFRVAADEADRVLAYLDERELLSYAYRRRRVKVQAGEEPVAAEAYLADPAHPEYAGKLDPEDGAVLVAQGVGASGTCFDYLDNTVRHLDRLGIHDGPLHELLGRVVERYRRAMSFEV